MSTVTLHHGDALDVLRTLPDSSIDAVITDPPYGLAEHKPATVTAALTAWCSGDRDHVPDGSSKHAQRCLHHLVRPARVRNANDASRMRWREVPWGYRLVHASC